MPTPSPPAFRISGDDCYQGRCAPCTRARSSRSYGLLRSRADDLQDSEHGARARGVAVVQPERRHARVGSTHYATPLTRRSSSRMRTPMAAAIMGPRRRGQTRSPSLTPSKRAQSSCARPRHRRARTPHRATGEADHGAHCRAPQGRCWAGPNVPSYPQAFRCEAFITFTAASNRVCVAPSRARALSRRRTRAVGTRRRSPSAAPVRVTVWDGLLRLYLAGVLDCGGAKELAGSCRRYSRPRRRLLIVKRPRRPPNYRRTKGCRGCEPY